MEPGQLLFLHIMKNGGTSVDRFLACKSKRGNAGFTLSLGEVHLYEGRTDCNDPSVCSTHGRWIERVEKCGAKFQSPKKMFTVLRNPVDRVFSMYNFQKANEYKKSGGKKSLPELSEMLQDCMTKGSSPNRDFMCQAMINHVTLRTFSRGNMMFNVTYNPKTVDQAKDLIEKLDAVFLMDDFPTFVEAFEKSGLLEESDHPARKKSCSLDHANPTECPVCHNKPTDSERQLIEKLNRMDMELYEYAKTMKKRFK